MNIDATRVGNIVQDTSKNGRSPNSHKATVFQSGLKDDFEGKITTGRWPANFILTHKEGCESQGEDWDCEEGCPVKELDRQRGDSRFFKQFKKDMIEYFKTMITPPVEDACVVVSQPNEIDFSAYKKEVFEEGALVPTYEPMVHGLILLGEPTDEQSKEIFKILKPGGHVILIPEDIGYKGVISLEDSDFEVRDAIFVADGDNDFHYCPKAGRSEKEAGLPPKDEGRANIHPTVKPIEVMEWCARDIAPNSKVVDPFLGSGTTGIAMSRLGHDIVGVELNPEYAKICESRIRHWMPIGIEIKSEAQVGKAEPQKGKQFSIFDIFDS